MLSRFRLWRLQRRYKALEVLHSKLPMNEDAAKLRADYASETIKQIRMGFVAQGVSREDRKRFLRRIVSGR